MSWAAARDLICDHSFPLSRALLAFSPAREGGRRWTGDGASAFAIDEPAPLVFATDGVTDTIAHT
jgi:hypothetical protein